MVLIVGPTAVGKTELCLNLAKHLNTEIFSCDSRQFYREMNIGTAKPTAKELAEVKHHFINNLSIENSYSVADFEREVIAGLGDYFEHEDIAVLTGGSGLFAKAITHGLDPMPEVPEALKEKLIKREKEEGLAVLVSELKVLDEAYCKEADLENKQRVIRALAVCLQTNKPYSSWLKNTKIERPFEIIKIAIDRPREELYERINLRVDLMLKSGLLGEVKSLEKYRSHNALQTVGYKEVFAHFDGEIAHEEMVELIKRNTRRYAKRQLTWFRNQDTFKWFNAEEEGEVLKYVLEQI